MSAVALQSSVATKSVTNTHLMVATAMLLAAGGLAYMAGAGSFPSSGGGYGYPGDYGYGYNACELSNVRLNNACAKKYNNTKVTCYNGKTTKILGCKTLAEAGAAAKTFCTGQCRGAKCGVNSSSNTEPCEQEFHTAVGTCADGSSAGEYGSASVCTRSSLLRSYLEGNCASKYCGAPIQVVTDQPSLTVSWGAVPGDSVITVNTINVHVATLILSAGPLEDVRVNSIKVRTDDSTALNSDSNADATFSNIRLTSIDGSVQFGPTLQLVNGVPDMATFSGINNLVIPRGMNIPIKVIVNVNSDSSGSYYFGTVAANDASGLGISSGNIAQVTGSGASSRITVTSGGTLTFSKAADNPLSRVVAVGELSNGAETDMLVLNASAEFEDVDVNSLTFYYTPVPGSAEQSSFGNIKLYRAQNSGAPILVGSTSLVPPNNQANIYAATFNISPGDLRIAKDTSTRLIVKADFQGTSNNTNSGMSPFIQLGNGSATDDAIIVRARGVSSAIALQNGQINGADNLNIAGNQVVLYSSFPTFTFVYPLSMTMVNGVENDIYSFKVRASDRGPVALKQLKFNLDVVDNVGTSNRDIAVGSLKLFRGSTDITRRVLITSKRVSGNWSWADDVSSNPLSFTTGTGMNFYVTWPHGEEEYISRDQEQTYTIKAVTSGFTTDADDDYVSVRLANTEANQELNQIIDPYYLTPSGAGSIERILALSDRNSANITSADLIWSDFSASDHSTATGTSRTVSSSGDWFNGYLLSPPLNYSILFR